MIYLILLFCLVVIIAEIVAYFWHRLLSHNHVIDIHTLIHDSHSLHHNDRDDASYGDFSWIVILVCEAFIVLYLAYVVDIISGYALLVVTAAMIFVVFYNWYIHKAYHTENHWLEYFEWFKHDRKEHMIHHVNHRQNYGVTTRLCDKIFGTYQSV